MYLVPYLIFIGVCSLVHGQLRSIYPYFRIITGKSLLFILIKKVLCSSFCCIDGIFSITICQCQTFKTDQDRIPVLQNRAGNDPAVFSQRGHGSCSPIVRSAYFPGAVKQLQGRRDIFICYLYIDCIRILSGLGDFYCILHLVSDFPSIIFCILFYFQAGIDGIGDPAFFRILCFCFLIFCIPGYICFIWNIKCISVCIHPGCHECSHICILPSVDGISHGKHLLRILKFLGCHVIRFCLTLDRLTGDLYIKFSSHIFSRFIRDHNFACICDLQTFL